MDNDATIAQLRAQIAQLQQANSLLEERLLAQANEQKSQGINEKLTLLEKFINKSTDAIQVSDEQGRLVYINDVSSKRLGIPRAQVHEYFVHDFEHIFREPGRWEAHVAYLKTHKTQVIEGVNFHVATGAEIPVEVTVTYEIIDGAGYIIATLRDITERKKIQDELHQQNLKLIAAQDKLRASMDELSLKNEEQQNLLEELRKNEEWLVNLNNELTEEKRHVEQALLELLQAEQRVAQSEKMAALGVLTAGIAHEINNPMNFISGGAQALTPILDEMLMLLDFYTMLEEATDEASRNRALQKLKEYKTIIGPPSALKEDVLELFHGIKQGVSRVSSIVKSLYNLSRKDEGARIPVQVHDSINHALAVFEKKAEGRIKIVKNYDPAIDTVMSYAGQLGQAFMNIIGNAIDAIEEEGTITICTCFKGNQVKISISDTGTGIKPDIQDKIFDPFFTTKEVGQGMGLGLSIAHSIIEKHQGSITVHSQEGEGTEIIIYLPK
jgi:PAS domain S-box-containing protein